MKIIAPCVSLFLAPLGASAAITVSLYSGADNLPQTVLAGEIHLANATGLSEGYARINNLEHSALGLGGDSDIGFMRFRYGDQICGYFYRSSNRGLEAPEFSGFESIETWQYVYWQGGGSLVDGAQWGSDNYILMRDAANTIVAVLQFNFDETGLAPTLLASAVDLGGLTFTQGVTAIEAAAIPEPSTFAALAGLAGFGFAALRRSRRV